MSIVPVELINQTPGFAGRLTQWIINTALYRQPQLSLAAALAATGNLKGHKVRSATNLRTNNLIIGLGLPSCGKGHTGKCIRMLFKEIGAEKHLAGVPTSDSGLLSSLVDGKGISLITWDEIGLGLQKITSPKSQSHNSNIINVIMQLFSAADEKYIGNQYSNRDKKNPRVDIEQPCLNIYGVSTPSRFYEALNSNFGSDGFLSRLLIFEPNYAHPRAEHKPEPCYVPHNLIKTATNILNEELVGDDDSLEELKPVREIKYSNRAYIILKGILTDKYYELKKKAKDEIIQSVYGRALEHIIKLALTVEPNDEMGAETLEWAEAVYDHLAHSLIDIITTKVSDSDFQRNQRKLVAVLKAGPVSQRDLSRATQWLKNRDREDILVSLLQTETIKAYKHNVNGSVRPTTFYELL